MAKSIMIPVKQIDLNFQLKPSVRGIFSSVLTGLATFDALFLMGAIVTFGMPHLSTIYQVSNN